MPITSRDIQQAFDVTPMTVINWRKGSVRRAALPCKIIPHGQRPRIEFDLAQVTAWALEHGIPFNRRLLTSRGNAFASVERKHPAPRTAQQAQTPL